MIYIIPLCQMSKIILIWKQNVIMQIWKKIKSPLKEAQIDMIGENNSTQSGEVLLCDCIRTGKGPHPLLSATAM